MEKTVSDLFRARVRSHAEKPFLFSGEARYTYREAGELVHGLARGFRRAGVKKGDKVCTLLPNSAEHLWVWLALARLGAVWVPLNTSLKKSDLSYTINDSDAALIVVDAGQAANFLNARPELRPEVEALFVGPPEERPASMAPLADLFLGGGELEESPVSLSDAMSIVYTGGTTGLPKGVLLPHFSYVSAGRRIVARCGVTSEDGFLRTTPLNHVAAQHFILAALVSGTYVALTPGFSASRYWDQARRYGTTCISCVGPMFEILLRQPLRGDDRDHPVRVMTSVELSAVPREKLEAFKARFGIEKIQEIYGMTEFGCLMTANPRERIKEGSIGTPSDHVEMDVFDEEDSPVAPGVTGELVVRPKTPFSGMLGYYKKPEETLNACRNLWFHTGDLGYRDAEGYFYIVGRKSHKIRRKGENVSPSEVEAVVDRHPLVEESVVVGVPSELGTDEDVKVFIRPKAGEVVDPLEIVRWCADRLAPYKVPRYVEFVAEFPRTEAVHRVERTKLKDLGVNGAWDRDASGYVLQK